VKFFLKRPTTQQDKNSIDEAKKPTTQKIKRSKNLIYGLLVVVVAGLGFWLYTQNDNLGDTGEQQSATPQKEEPLESTEPLNLDVTDGSQLYRVVYTTPPEGGTHAVVDLFNQETNSFETYDDSASLRDFKVSEDGRYVAKIDGEAVYLAETAEPLDFKEVIPPAAEPTTNNQLVWLSDSSGFLVRNRETTESQGYFESYKFTVSRYNIGEQSMTELFTHRETMGGIQIVDTDTTRDELYWFTSGEGGMRDHLYVNRISNGEEVLVKSRLPEADTHAPYDMFVRDGSVYYRATMPDYSTNEHTYLRVYEIDEDHSWPVFGYSKTNEAENSNRYSKPNIQWFAPGVDGSILTMLNVADGDDRLTGVYELVQRPRWTAPGNTLLRRSGSYYLSYHEGTFEDIGTFIATFCPDECEEERSLYLLRDKRLYAVPAAHVSTNGTVYLTSSDN